MSVNVGQMKYKAEIVSQDITTNDFGEIVEMRKGTKPFYCDIIRQDQLVDKGAGRFEYSTHQLTAIVDDFVVNTGDVIQVGAQRYRVIAVRYVTRDNIFYILEAKLEMIT